ncbi:MAG TPA: NapC/NirT family cytochrome c [Vicinamibacterales bacterium]|nr:NapC/NirT family cytochrome c [Vicinamibacterales bacterium]
MAEARLARNPTSIAGAVITTIAALAFLLFVALESFDLLNSPYAGLLGYVLIPAAFLLGLALIPFGMWREGRRRKLGRAAWNWPAIDLGHPATLRTIAAVGVLTLVNLGVVAVASVGVVHYTESNKFCGAVCHTPMTPQFTAHGFSPHSHVECVSCHVGPGAKGLVSAKLNGTRQLYEFVLGSYSRPIPEPLGRIPGAADTCMHCHTPGRPSEDIIKTKLAYADDEQSTESASTLTMHLGAIHWHARPDVVVEYVASDAARQTIPYVKVTDAQGKASEFFAEGVTARPAGELHRMDCIDCHNRPAHTFSVSADKAADALIASGAVKRDVPFLKKELVAALSAEYASHEAADTGIANHLRQAWKSADARLAPEIDRAVTAAQQLYRHNVFPDMKVTWGTYLSQLGHMDAPGCTRCHDDSHKSTAGAVIKNDCESCHKMQ